MYSVFAYELCDCLWSGGADGNGDGVINCQTHLSTAPMTDSIGEMSNGAGRQLSNEHRKLKTSWIL